jgi:large subunit ribosomal protein L4
MMKLDILKQNGEKAKDISLDKDLFGIEPNEKVIKDAIVVARAALRQGTHKTKTRSEVSGGGRKPWAQKGTGRARQGSIRSVQWKGGGISFGPVPRTHNKKQNRKERKLALKSAYSSIIRDENLLLIETINFKTPKTTEMNTLLSNLNMKDMKVLIIVENYSENVVLASRNIKKIMVAKWDEVGVLELASARKVLVEEKALANIKEVLK